MQTFAEFLQETAQRGEVINLAFEQRLFELVGILERITRVLSVGDVPHELIDGLAVFVHVESADPEQSILTRDVDLMVYRHDLERIIALAEGQGFRFRHVAGVDMLLYGETSSARNAVHLLFSGEKVRDSQPMPNPPIEPEVLSILGHTVQVISVAGLLQMKLNAFRDKDRVHVRSMDSAGLISPAIEEGLPEVLKERLRYTRATE